MIFRSVLFRHSRLCWQRCFSRSKAISNDPGLISSKFIVDSRRGSGQELSLDAVDSELSGILTNLKADFAKIHAGRLVPSMCFVFDVYLQQGQFDNIKAMVDGAAVGVRSLGSVSIRDANTAIFVLYRSDHAKALIAAMQSAQLNLTCQQEGPRIIVTMPKLTKELRQDMAKGLSGMAESCKKMMRSVRIAAIKASLKVIKEKDVQRLGEQEIQKRYEEFCKSVDKVVDAKQKEILG